MLICVRLRRLLLRTNGKMWIYQKLWAIERFVSASNDVCFIINTISREQKMPRTHSRRVGDNERSYATAATSFNDLLFYYSKDGGTIVDIVNIASIWVCWCVYVCECVCACVCTHMCVCRLGHGHGRIRVDRCKEKDMWFIIENAKWFPTSAWNVMHIWNYECKT